MGAGDVLAEGWLEGVGRALADVEVPEAADGVAQVRVSGSPTGLRSFHAVVQGGRVSVAAGAHPHPDMVLSWNYGDLVLASQGELSVESAYMSGRLKLEGDQVLLFDGWRPLRRSAQFRAALACF